MSSAIARITGPIWATTAYEKVGAWLVFVITSACQLLSFVLLLSLCRRMNAIIEEGEEKSPEEREPRSLSRLQEEESRLLGSS